MGNIELAKMAGTSKPYLLVPFKFVTSVVFYLGKLFFLKGLCVEIRYNSLRI